MTHHYEVDQGDSVEVNAPEVHHGHHVRGNHGNGQGADERTEEVKAQEDEGHAEHCAQDDAQRDLGLVDDGQVLLVVDVEDTAAEILGLKVLGIVLHLVNQALLQ